MPSSAPNCGQAFGTLGRLIVAVCLPLAAACSPPTGTDDPPENSTPRVNITSPSTGANFFEGDTVTFEGSARDPEDGALTGSSLVWSSSEDGRLGTGERLTATLSLGSHTVTLTAADSKGAKSSDEVAITVKEPPDPPTPTLKAKLPRPDLDFSSEDLRIADGEAVIFLAEVERADSCRVTGNSSYSVSPGKTVTTEGLSGPTRKDYVLECENAGGTGTDTLMVDIGAPGTRHATSNRPDRSDSLQTKFFYLVRENGRDRELDLDGTLEKNYKEFLDRLAEETGKVSRVDTYIDGNGKERYDATYAVVDREKLEKYSVPDAIGKEIEERGLDNRPEKDGNKVIVKYYDGPYTGVCSGGGAHGITILLWKCNPHPTRVAHEFFHALGVVDRDAPNYDEEHPGHVDDSDQDLMYFAPPTGPNNSIVAEFDVNCDDYWRDTTLVRCEDSDPFPPELPNVAENPIFIPAGG